MGRVPIYRACASTGRRLRERPDMPWICMKDQHEHRKTNICVTAIHAPDIVPIKREAVVLRSVIVLWDQTCGEPHCFVKGAVKAGMME